MIRYIERYGYGSVHNPYDTDYLLVDSDEKGWEYIMRVGACGEINTLHRNESLGKWNVVFDIEKNRQLFEAIPEMIIVEDVLKRCPLAQLLRNTYWLARR